MLWYPQMREYLWNNYNVKINSILTLKCFTHINQPTITNTKKLRQHDSYIIYMQSGIQIERSTIIQVLTIRNLSPVNKFYEKPWYMPLETCTKKYLYNWYNLKYYCPTCAKCNATTFTYLNHAWKLLLKMID